MAWAVEIDIQYVLNIGNKAIKIQFHIQPLRCQILEFEYPSGLVLGYSFNHTRTPPMPLDTINGIEGHLCLSLKWLDTLCLGKPLRIFVICSLMRLVRVLDVLPTY